MYKEKDTVWRKERGGRRKSEDGGEEIDGWG